MFFQNFFQFRRAARAMQVFDFQNDSFSRGAAVFFVVLRVNVSSAIGKHLNLFEVVRRGDRLSKRLFVGVFQSDFLHDERYGNGRNPFDFRKFLFHLRRACRAVEPFDRQRGFPARGRRRLVFIGQNFHFFEAIRRVRRFCKRFFAFVFQKNFLCHERYRRGRNPLDFRKFLFQLRRACRAVESFDTQCFFHIFFSCPSGLPLRL